MRITKNFLLTGALALSLALVGCGKAELGESCDEKGSTDECVENSVCDESKGEVTCLKVCTADTDCAATENCNGVTGSATLKACKPK